MRSFESQPWLWYLFDCFYQQDQNQGLTITNVPEDRVGEEIRDAIRIDGDAVRGQLDELVRSTVEETLNSLLDAEADQLCEAKRYERSAE